MFFHALPLPRFAEDSRAHSAQQEEIPELADTPAVCDDPDGKGIPMPRRVRITRDILEKVGYTPRCPGCLHVRLNKDTHRARHQACMDRVEKLMRQDETFKGHVE